MLNVAGKFDPACGSLLQSACRKGLGEFHTVLWSTHNLFTLGVMDTCVVSLVGRVTGRVFFTVVAQTHLHTSYLSSSRVNIQQRMCQSSLLGQHLNAEKAFIFPEEHPSNKPCQQG